MSKILITGGTGLVGKRLTEILQQRNHAVHILSRNPKNKNEFKWDIENSFIDDKAFIGVDFIIHLAGAGIADERWSEKRKKIILNSRIKSAELLLKKIKKLNIKLKGFISASGIGYYGAITSKKIFKEEDIPSTDFLGNVCVKWEAAANKFKNLEIPVTIFRTGIVLSRKGGALEKMKTPIVSPLGSGKQYLPWIHIDDLCYMYILSVEKNWYGIFNAVAPEHHTSLSFSKKLATVFNKTFTKIAVPKFLLKVMFGEMSIILLEGSRISSKKIENKGYSFRFKSLGKALVDIAT